MAPVKPIVAPPAKEASNPSDDTPPLVPGGTCLKWMIETGQLLLRMPNSLAHYMMAISFVSCNVPDFIMSYRIPCTTCIMSKIPCQSQPKLSISLDPLTPCKPIKEQ